MAFAYFISHNLIANNLPVFGLFFLILFAGIFLLPKLRFLVLNPPVMPLAGVFVLATYFFSQSPGTNFWVVLLATVVLIFYVLLDIVFLAFSRTEAIFLGGLAVLFLILRMPDSSLTYTAMALIFTGLLAIKFLTRAKSGKFKLWAAVGFLAAIFMATYLTHRYYSWQAKKMVESIGEAARFVLENNPLEN